eukprot:552366_1
MFTLNYESNIISTKSFIIILVFFITKTFSQCVQCRDDDCTDNTPKDDSQCVEVVPCTDEVCTSNNRCRCTISGESFDRFCCGGEPLDGDKENRECHWAGMSTCEWNEGFQPTQEPTENTFAPTSITASPSAITSSPTKLTSNPTSSPTGLTQPPTTITNSPTMFTLAPTVNPTLAPTGLTQPPTRTTLTPTVAPSEATINKQQLIRHQ